MTGGRVVVLGPTGRNFAAGMSGGIAYVYDPNGTFQSQVNTEMVYLEQITEHYENNEVHLMIRNHHKFTGSEVAHRILESWEESVLNFVKVIPKDYKRMFESIERGKKSGLSNDQAIMAAFEENMRDISRVGGN
jgi:glutamate synthase domain-containing protein 3